MHYKTIKYGDVYKIKVCIKQANNVVFISILGSRNVTGVLDGEVEIHDNYVDILVCDSNAWSHDCTVVRIFPDNQSERDALCKAVAVEYRHKNPSRYSVYLVPKFKVG